MCGQIKLIEQTLLWNTKPEILKYGSNLRGPCVKIEGLVFHGTAREIRLINSLLYSRNENIPKIHREFADNFWEKLFFTKLVQNHRSKVLCWFSSFPKIVRKLTEKFPKLIAHEFYQKHFSEFYNFPTIFENFETSSVNVRFQSSLAVNPSGRMPNDQPIRLQESRQDK